MNDTVASTKIRKLLVLYFFAETVKMNLLHKVYTDYDMDSKSIFGV